MTPEDSLLGLGGHTALVVGAGQGIGRASASLLARAGCRLALVDCVEERVRAVAAEIGDGAVPIVADVTRAADADRAVAEAAAGLGRVDHLVDIVGAANWAPLLEMDEETWERDHVLNLKQHWYVSRATARSMIDAGGNGSIVVVASLSGLFSAAGHGAYGAAKAGLVGLTRTMAEEWAAHGIRVNAVAPGTVRTPRIEAAWEAGEIPRPDAETLARIADPDDVASAALFLSSALARKVTGHTLVVDGGTSTAFPFRLA